MGRVVIEVDVLGLEIEGLVVVDVAVVVGCVALGGGWGGGCLFESVTHYARRG